MSLAKTTRPVLQSVVMRDRLFAVLDEASDRSLVWISAPPGYGKSTLVSSYVEARKLPHIWYRLDSGDADIAAFVHFMAEAARRVQSARARPLPKLSSQYATDVPAFARHYFRQLYDSVTLPVAIILDNYQEVPRQSAIHEVLKIGLNEMPRKTRAIFVSRTEPPAEMAPLAASGAMVVLGPDLLRLTLDEVKQLVKLRDFEIRADVVRQLYEKTGGWAAGVVLMLEDARKRGTLADLPESQLTMKIIFDYLAGEVFEKFEEPIQLFLLKIANTPQLSADMAERLTGERNARRILINLALNNYFVTENRSHGKSEFRLHPLFREFLLERGGRSLTLNDRAALKRNAAQYLLEDGEVDAAVEILFEVAAWDEVARVVKEYAANLLGQGRSSTVLHWLDRLPAEGLREDPWMLYWLGACQIHSSPREARRHFAESFQKFVEDAEGFKRGRILSACGVIDSTIHEFDDLGSLPEWNARLVGALKAGGEQLCRGEMEHLTLSLFTSLTLAQPDHNVIRSYTSRAFSVLRNGSGAPETRANASALTMGLLALSSAKPLADEIQDLIQVGIANADLAPMDQVSLLSARSFCLAMLGEHRSCIETASRGLEVARARGIGSRVNQLLANCVAGNLGAGEYGNASALLTEMQASLRGGKRVERCIHGCLAAWLALNQEQPIVAFEHLNTAARLSRELGVPLLEAVCRVGLAQALLDCGDAARSDIQRRKADSIATAIGSPLLSFTLGILTAQMERQEGRQAECAASLRAALRIGHRHNFTYCIWWHPGRIAALLEFALYRNIEPTYVRHLIRQRRLVRDVPPLDLDTWPWNFRIYTLGRFRILKDDSELTPSKKSDQRPIELLKVLVAKTGRNVESNALAKALWPHVDEEYAYKSFTIALHRLRKFLGDDDVLLLRDGKLSVNTHICWVDTAALVHVSEGIEDMAAARLHDRERVNYLADKLLAVYQGPFLQDMEQHESFITARAKLREVLVHTLIRVRTWHEDAGNWEIAAGLYERAIKADRLCEELYEALMKCYHEHGMRNNALEVYRNWQGALRGPGTVHASGSVDAMHRLIVGND
ncbi:MAG: hypothetical protein HYY36_00815 [Gammaproteobacteria bacterium]|nr:hypothetical protein [Gammaproteobacteria bacterium]